MRYSEATMSSPPVAVVIVSFNTRDLLRECLESLKCAGNVLLSGSVVVDNASHDGSPDMVRQCYPGVRLISNATNLGFARACNQGIRSTSAPFVLLLNSDARISESCLDALLSSFSLKDTCGAAGCSLVDATGRERPSTWHFLTPFNQALELLGLTRFAPERFGRSYKPRPGPDGIDCSVDWVEASCLMVRRTAVEQTPLFDERFFMYSEDEDLCWRLRRSGWMICYSNRGRAVHHGGASAEQNPLQNLCHFYRSQYLLLLKHNGRASAQFFLAANKTALLLKRVWHRLSGNNSRLSDSRLRWKAIKHAGQGLHPPESSSSN
jgi:GT2 family glycosyltransferase